jgi:uncharacterized membrane protein YdjX (TVP38/TMEM64 family)
LLPAVAVLAVGALVVAAFLYGPEVDTAAVRVWLTDLGPIAPLAYIVIYMVQVVVGPVPGLPIGAAAGFVFGLVPAMIYGLIGLGLGVAIALVAGRTWGLRLLSRVAGPDKIARWEQMRLINSPVTWLLIFLGPSPDLILFVAGMSRIPLPRLFLVGLVGRAPAMFGATLLGAGAFDAGPWLLVGATVLGTLICFGGALMRRAQPPMQPAEPQGASAT